MESGRVALRECQWVLATTDGVSFRYDAGFWSAGWRVAATELNGDLRADIFLWIEATGQWVEVFNGGAGFTFASGMWTPGWRPYFADFTADRRDDLLLYNLTTGAFSEAINAGAGAFIYGAGDWGLGWTILSK